MPKYILITTDTIWIPGDERSRTNPGHGYPERTEVVQKVKFFDTEAELLGWRETWGKNEKDPIVFELNGRVKFEEKLTISLSKS